MMYHLIAVENGKVVSEVDMDAGDVKGLLDLFIGGLLERNPGESGSLRVDEAGRISMRVVDTLHGVIGTVTILPEKTD